MKETNSKITRYKNLYNRDYYFGVTSGYPPEGYSAAHPDWTAWLGLIQTLCPQGRLLDVGCAFGYLPAEARDRGYQAYGSDISSYALRQEPTFRPFLFQADAHQLPLVSRSFDVVTLFDVLEHLSNPVNCLSEAVRLLRPEGILVGATPDPLFFSRKEETHFYERPPSFWIDRLSRLDMDVRFRFSVEPYNFQFVAAHRGSRMADKLTIFQHDYFSVAPEITHCQGDLTLLPRHGWGELKNGTREMVANPATFYLLNPTPEPRRLTLKLNIVVSHHFSTLRIRFNSYVVKDLHLSSEKQVYEVGIDDLLVPPGGHHLFFELFPGGPKVFAGRAEAADRPATRKELCLGLPFDLYQRYRLALEMLRILRPESVLDVGGVIGDRDGHLAVPADFFGQIEETSLISSTDLRHCDHPEHHPAPAHRQPWPDMSYEAVVSLDVLEHLPADLRRPFLNELDRVATRWIILGGPFASPEVEAAEESLHSLFQNQTFLHEHEEQGLPSLEEVSRFYSAKGHSIYRLPSGFLPRWKQMQAWTQLYFSFSDYWITRTFNSLYNEHCYDSDQRDPAYRQLLLIARSPLPASYETALKNLQSNSPTGLESLASDSRFLDTVESAIRRLDTLHRALSDAQFLANARQEGIELIQKDMEETSILRFILRRWRRWRGRN